MKMPDVHGPVPVAVLGDGKALELIIKSLMRLSQLNLSVPEHTHMSRRAGQISQMVADSAHDTKGCNSAIAGRDADATLSPRDGAIFCGDGHPRDAIPQDVAAKGSAGWKNDSGYHRRSLAENMLYQLKKLGDRLYSRTSKRHAIDAHVPGAILNTFTYLGMPRSVGLGQIARAA